MDTCDICNDTRIYQPKPLPGVGPGFSCYPPKTRCWKCEEHIVKNANKFLCGLPRDGYKGMTRWIDVIHSNKIYPNVCRVCIEKVLKALNAQRTLESKPK